MRTFRAATLSAAMVAAAANAGAQGIASNFTELRLLVRPGDRITVTGSNGAITGTLARLSSSVLVLDAGRQTVELRESDVTAIRQRRSDSLQNGALIGLGVGAGLFLAAVAGADDLDLSGWAAIGALECAGLGAGIGAGVDALITRRQVIYERASGQEARVSVSLVATPGRRGVRASIRF
jgi:hypothetical protein